MAPKIVERLPDPQTYLDLRAAGGLSSYSLEAARTGLPKSLHCVVLELGGEDIGMGRIVGDGALSVQIVDIVVRPEYHGKGYGRLIVQALSDYIASNIPDTAYVNLLADVPANRLYEKFGFRETAPATIGMAYKKGSE
ncbi:N-acetyltransferase [Roseibium polysiphoniae]|uniref:N-acetyltransferase n=1 Tax=Roseibium polysiphoniae TaxID=2571221 RepID=A0A944CFD3_9HYPH|nr:N-acetyltransferase [Roseibium polysiphoniae]